MASQAGDYDPYANRERGHTTTNAETFVLLVKSALGTGLLAMPFAFRNAGLVVGTISTFAVGAFCTYGLHLMVQSMYRVLKTKRVPLLPFGEAVEGAVEQGPEWIRPASKFTLYLVEFFILTYQAGIGSIYLVFISTIIKEVADDHTGLSINFGGIATGVMIVLLFLNQVRNLKLLAPVSALATFTMFSGLGIIFYYIFSALPNPKTLPKVAPVKQFPVFLGTVLFAMESIGVIISLENNMTNPERFIGFFGVLNAGMSVVVSLYAFVGFFGYVRYGDEIKSVITMNIPMQGLGEAVKIMYAISVLLSYPLQMWPCQEILWGKYISKHYVEADDKHYVMWETLFRAFLVFITFMVAILAPNLSFIISLVGVFCLSMLGITFPALMEICTLYPDNYGKKNWKAGKDLLMMGAGIFSLIIGLYSSIHDLLVPT